MPVIEVLTVIHAPRERVFDIARSIDAHQDSTSGTAERAVAGNINGLIGMGESVTWEARHFGIRQQLTVRVTAFEPSRHFQDRMISGPFKRMVHDHDFADVPGGTLMHDRFEFESPLGIPGGIVDWLFLAPYLRQFLVHRAEALKLFAESSRGSRYLGEAGQKRWSAKHPPGGNASRNFAAAFAAVGNTKETE